MTSAGVVLGGDYFKFFRHRGAIIRGRRLLEDDYYSRKYGNCAIKTIN